MPMVATPSAARDFLVVSIHDVSAFDSGNCRQDGFGNLRGKECRRVRCWSCPITITRALLWKILTICFLVTRGLEAQGYEAVIHGHFHERPRPRRETVRDRLVTRVYTQNEGEFYDLPYDEALRRITRARDDFLRRWI